VAVITIENVKQLKQLGGAKHGWVTQIVWSPDGRTLAIAHGAGVTLYVDGFGGTPTHILPHPVPVESMAFHPQKPIIATGSKDTLVRLWLSPNTPIELRGHRDAVNSVAISPDGRFLLSGSSDKTMRLWDISSPQSPVEHAVLSGEHSDEITTVTFLTHTKAETRFASGSRDRTLRIWNAPGEVSEPLRHADRLRRLAVSGDLLASASRDEMVRLWRVGSDLNAQLVATIHAHSKGVDCVAFNTSNTLLATGGRDNLIRLWDIQQILQSGKTEMGDALLELGGQEKPVLALAFNPAGTLLVSGSGDNQVRLWGL